MDEFQEFVDRARTAVQRERWRDVFEAALSGIERCPTNDRLNWIGLRVALSLAVTQLELPSSQDIFQLSRSLVTA